MAHAACSVCDHPPLQRPGRLLKAALWALEEGARLLGCRGEAAAVLLCRPQRKPPTLLSSATQEEALQKGQQWLSSLQGGAKDGGAARKGRGFKPPSRAKPLPAKSPRELRQDGAEIAPREAAVWRAMIDVRGAQ